MKFLYNTGIYLYVTAIRLASLYNKKAKIWIDGRRRLLKEISQTIPEFTKIIWVHCSSLGEFEQGRPVIERLKSRCPDYKILLTFFSPSGYEIRKHYPGADYVFYLPADTPGNARKFIDHTRPAMALFIKYEYWYNYLNVLQEKKIPVFLFSAIFRPGQIFFRWYGKWWKKILFMFDHIFVQNESSGHLLKKSGITSVTVSGDTRFDRVHQIASNVKPIAIARDFLNNAFTVIAGSTWPVDEALLVEFINNNQENIKWIIAPHEIKSDQLMKLQSSIAKPAVFYSQVTREKLPASDYNVLIIDNIGMLSSLYTYGQVAYIGGGFGKGIHNILEAATFGLPVVFGPNFRKFNEAVELVKRGSAFVINDAKQLEKTIYLLHNNNEFRKSISATTRKYVLERTGATRIIVDKVLNYIRL